MADPTNVPVGEMRGSAGAVPVLLADETQLMGSYRNGGYALVVGGIVFSVMTVVRLGAAQRDEGILVVFLCVALGTTFAGFCLLAWRHRFHLLKDRGEIVETSGLLVAESPRIHPLSKFREVELLQQMREVIFARQGLLNTGEKPREMAYIVQLTGAPDSGDRPLLLGQFGNWSRDHAKALDLAMSVALETGLDLVDRCGRKGARVVKRDELKRLEEPVTGPPPDRRPTAIALIVANFIPMFGVLFAGWELLPVLILFWCENVVVGFLNVLRMLFAGREHGSKMYLVPFFIVHYGIFCLGHALFLLALFGGKEKVAGAGGLFSGAERIVEIVSDKGLWIAVAGLLASHGFSFIRNYLGGGEYLRVTPNRLMTAPYNRVVVMHMGLIAGAGLMTVMDASAAFLAALVVGKIGIDLHAHLGEHRRFSISGYESGHAAPAERGGIE